MTSIKVDGEHNEHDARSSVKYSRCSFAETNKSTTTLQEMPIINNVEHKKNLINVIKVDGEHNKEYSKPDIALLQQLRPAPIQEMSMINYV